MPLEVESILEELCNYLTVKELDTLLEWLSNDPMAEIRLIEKLQQELRDRE